MNRKAVLWLHLAFVLTILANGLLYFGGASEIVRASVSILSIVALSFLTLWILNVWFIRKHRILTQPPEVGGNVGGRT